MTTSLSSVTCSSFRNFSSSRAMPKMGKVLIASTIAERIAQVEAKLTAKLKLETFVEKDLATVYNPLVYADEPHRCYLQKWCNSPREVMFLGMNPGPFGMCQNGVPFGEIDTVKQWLRIKGKVMKPEKEDPNRKIEGMDVKRKEVSGQRLWGLFKEVSKKPEVFFKNCIVYNYIPLCFIHKTGKNIAPDQLKPATRNRLISLCNEAICEILDILQVKIVIGVGKWTEARLQAIKKENKLQIEVLGIMHPSPLNPKANKDYIGIVQKDLERLGVLRYLLPDENSEYDPNNSEDDASDASEEKAAGILRYFKKDASRKLK